jgi:hypothetical protein
MKDPCFWNLITRPYNMDVRYPIYIENVFELLQNPGEVM